MKFHTHNKYLELDCSVQDKDNFGDHISLPVTALFKYYFDIKSVSIGNTFFYT